MTREEELQQFAEQNTKGLHLDRHNLIQMVKQGAEWAYSHPQWIPVEDELPTIPENYICVEVLFRTKDRTNHLGKYFGDKWISYEDYTYKTEDISHWMLILPPRKEE